MNSVRLRACSRVGHGPAGMAEPGERALTSRAPAAVIEYAYTAMRGQMTGGMAKAVLGQAGTVDSSGLDTRLAAFLGKGTPLEFAVEATNPGGIVVPDQCGRSAAAWVPPPGSIRIVTP